MTIYSSTYDMLRSALQAWSRDSMVMLYQEEHFGADDLLEVKVNWSCSGNCSTEETARFIEALQVASRLADEINRAGYHVADSYLLQGPVIPEAMIPAKREAHRAEVEKVYGWLSSGRWSAVSRWLEDQRVA